MFCPVFPPVNFLALHTVGSISVKHFILVVLFCQREIVEGGFTEGSSELSHYRL